MKTKIIFTSFLTAAFLGGTALAQNSASGSTSGGAQVGVGSSAGVTGTQTGVVPRNGISPVRPLTPQNGSPVPSQTQIQTPGITASNQTVFSTNGFLGTNGFGSNNVTAIVNPMTNSPVAVNSNFNGNIVFQDQAITPSDRVLLTTLSQGVRATLSITPNGNLPVHFFINNGTVTVVGTVQSSEQSQAVLAQVQQTPGVISVIDSMHVSGPFAPATISSRTGALATPPVDRAFSPADQTLLTTVQQEAAFQLGINSSAQMPVHFSIQNGVVGVTGMVSSLQEKQALLASIQRTPGIVRVVDNVAVIPSSTGVSGFNPGNNNNLSPTSRTNQ